MIGLGGVLAIVSGIYLYVEGQALREASSRIQQQAKTQVIENGVKEPALPPQASGSAAIPAASSASASASASAPASAAASELASPPAEDPASTIDAASAVIAALEASTGEPAAPAAPRPQRLADAGARIKDELRTPAMAPVRELIEIVGRDANARSGPGLGYPVVARVNGRERFDVQEKRNQWFRIAIPSGKARKTAWVRGDLVRAIR
jgi:uncharacterized protein YgiM (DUF1202 family)